VGWLGFGWGWKLKGLTVWGRRGEPVPYAGVSRTPLTYLWTAKNNKDGGRIFWTRNGYKWM